MELGRATWPEVAATGAAQPAGPAGRVARAARSAPAPRHRHPHRRRAGDELARTRCRTWWPRRPCPTAPAASTRRSPGPCWSTTSSWPSWWWSWSARPGPPSRGVVVVSAHGGNREGLALAEERCRAEGDDVVFWRVRCRGRDAHAGRTETSLMLWIDAAAVRMDLAEAGMHRANRRVPAPVARRRGAADIVQRRAGGSHAGQRRGRARPAGSMTADLVGRRQRPLAAGRGRRMSPVAVVTGAGRGIGAATVDRLVSDGWQVVAVDVCADDPASTTRWPRRRISTGWRRATAQRSRRWSAMCEARPT